MTSVYFTFKEYIYIYTTVNFLNNLMYFYYGNMHMCNDLMQLLPSSDNYKLYTIFPAVWDNYADPDLCAICSSHFSFYSSRQHCKSS